jgi:hypothetical protein
VPLDDPDAVTLKITPHQAQQLPSRPADAIELLWARLGANREGTSFAVRGSEIQATWESTATRSMPRAELNEVARAAVLALLREVCDAAPELEFAWFAVSSA